MDPKIFVIKELEMMISRFPEIKVIHPKTSALLRKTPFQE